MSEIEKTIRLYLASSAGTSNYPTNRTLNDFVGMIETGEASLSLFTSIGGEWLTTAIRDYARSIDSVVE